ncbi:hypothetical protein ACRZF5_005098, partial [Citrobacter freundii]
MKQRLPLARTDLVWCCPELPVNHYVLPFSHVILDLVLVRYEREADIADCPVEKVLSELSKGRSY